MPARQPAKTGKNSTRARKPPTEPAPGAFAPSAPEPAATRPAPKRPRSVPFDLPGLLAKIDRRGALWQKSGLNFDWPGVEPVGFVLLLDEPPVSIAFQTYNQRISPKFLARLEAAEGAPVRDVAAAINGLRRRGYVLVKSPADVGTRPRRRGRPRKTPL